MILSYDSSITLHELEIRNDNKHYIVENILFEEFFEMPTICVEAIKQMKSGLGLKEVEDNLKNNFPEEDVDILDFVHQLVDLGIVKKVDGKELENEKKNVKPKSFQWISPIVGKILFNKFSIVGFSILFFTNIIFLLKYPFLFPSYKDLFIFDVMTFNILAWFAVTLLLVLVHEFGHILAVRSYHLPAKLGIGHRLFLVVFETDMSSVWKLPRQKRIVLFLAGLCLDTAILFLALLVQIIFPSSSPLLIGLMGIVVLDAFIRTVYQCCFYMKTDLYYVFENITGCYNLMENSKQLIKKVLLRRKESKDNFFQGEEKVVFSFAIFYIIGVGFSLFLFCFYYFPQLLYAVSKAIDNLTAPITNILFWDSVLILLQVCLMVLLLLLSWVKKYWKGA
jgi:putative peptide zinc metalloprotease protein